MYAQDPIIAKARATERSQARYRRAAMVLPKTTLDAETAAAFSDAMQRYGLGVTATLRRLIAEGKVNAIALTSGSAK